MPDQPAPGIAPGTTPGTTPESPPADGAAAVQTPSANSTSTWTRVKVAALTAALAGMVIGAVVEMFVQGWLESTGWFGPTLDTVIEEQLTNFNAVQAKLAELQAATSDADRDRLADELTKLLAKQEQLTNRTHDELRTYHRQVESLREQALATTGAAGGADVWLGPGEGVSVGGREDVFAVNSVHRGYLYATLNGKRHTIYPGGFAETANASPPYRVYLKSMPTDTNPDRAGFDIVRMDK